MDERLINLAGSPKGSSRSWVIFFTVLVLIGTVTFLVGISGPDTKRAWQAYLVNFLFWFGLASGSMLFVAVLNLTNARWGRPLKRMAEALGSFTLVSYLLFWVLYFGGEKIFPWIGEPVPGKERWLNSGFLFLRNGGGLFLLAGISTVMLYCSVKGDLNSTVGGATSGKVGRDHPGRTPQGNRLWRAQIMLSPILGILYAFVLSLVAFDLIMSLDPHWYSTLFGGYYFVGSFYVALAAITVLAGIGHDRLGLQMIIRPRQFHDLGKLLLGFCLMTGYLFYAQFLVIWYGNISEEARYIIERVHQNPWKPLGWIILGTGFALPFFVLLSKKIKVKVKPMIVLGIAILTGMWLERFLLVAPSLWKGQTMPLGLMEILVSSGFFGALGLTTMLFLKKFPLLPVSDPLFLEEVKTILKETDTGHFGKG